MRLLFGFLCLLLVGCQSTPPPLTPDFAFVHVNVINVATGEIKPDQIVMIEGDKIVATGDFATTTIPTDTTTVFAEGQYLMPGLMDSHAHAFRSVEHPAEEVTETPTEKPSEKPTKKLTNKKSEPSAESLAKALSEEVSPASTPQLDPVPERELERDLEQELSQEQIEQPTQTPSSDPIQAAIATTLPLFVAHGVTRVRDMGTSIDTLKNVRQRLNDSPDLIRPVMISTGPLIDSLALPWYGNLQLIIQDESEVSAMVTRLEANGITQLKTYTNLDPAIYKAIANQARIRGLRIAGHVPLGVSLEEVAAARQLSIEHLDVLSLLSCATDDRDWFIESLNARFSEEKKDYFTLMAEYWRNLDWEKCEPALQAISDSGGYWTPTLVMETSDMDLVDKSALAYLAPPARKWCEQNLQATKDSPPATQDAAYNGLKHALDRVRAAGIPLLAGSDTPNHCLAPGASLIWELIRMADFGLTNLEVLQTATLNPAMAFRGQQREVLPDHPAELILLDQNPLENLEALKQLQGVYLHGRWLDSAALRQIKETARQYASNQTSD